jgi:hypothetical protein
MPRTSYDPVLDANRPQSGGLYPAPVRPWWETLNQDPWYITGAKAVLGEREVEGMRRGEIAPWIETVAPLLFMGRGPKGEVIPRMRRPEPPPSLLDQIEALNTQVKSTGEMFQRAGDVLEKFDFGGKRPLKPFDPAQFKESFPEAAVPYSPIPPVPSDPWEAQQFWKAFDRGMLPGQGGKSAFQQPMEWQNWKYLPRPEDLIGGGYHSDDPALGFMEPGDVPPPYGYQSPLKITPEDIAKVPTPPGIVITPQDVGQLPAATPFTAKEAFNIQKLGLKPPNLSNLEYQRAYDQFIQEQATKTGDGHEVPGGLFFKNQFPGYQLDYQYGPGPQPEVPARFLPPAPDPTPPPTFDFGEFGYIYPQMPFYPQTDWYRSLRDVQSYPGENAYAIA